MADLWISCTLRPPGFDPGDPGPGGGGDGGGGCVGDECDDDDDCGSFEYTGCAIFVEGGAPSCQQQTFTCDTEDEAGESICDGCEPKDSWVSSSDGLGCAGDECTGKNPLVWKLTSRGGTACEKDCDPLCNMWICPGAMPPVGQEDDAEKEECIDDQHRASDFVKDSDCGGISLDGYYLCPTEEQSPCDGPNQTRHWFTEAECNDNEPGCQEASDEDCYTYAYVCETPSEQGDCVQDVINDKHECFETFFTPDCVPTAATQCTVGEPPDDETFYKDQQECMDTCKLEVSCTYWICDTDADCIWHDDGFISDSCVEEVETNSTLDSKCTSDGYEHGEGEYATSDDAKVACITCPDYWECTPGSPGSPGGSCDSPGDCAGQAFDPVADTCHYTTTTCYKSPEECYESGEGCQCPHFVVCEMCLDPTGLCEDNTSCSVVVDEGRDEEGNCLYDNIEKHCDDSTTDKNIADGDRPDCTYNCDIDNCTPANKACLSECVNDSLECYECPSIGDAGECCTKTCFKKGAKDVGGKCPSHCFEEESDCNDTCTKLCYVCEPGPEPRKNKVCVEVATPCSEDCAEYDSLPQCEKNCTTTPLTEFDENEEAVMFTYNSGNTDSVYQRNVANKKYYTKTGFLPVKRGPLPASLFNEEVHYSLVAVYLINNDSNRLFSDYPYTNLHDRFIEKSLNTELVELLNTVKLATGETIKKSFIQTIRQLLISNRLNDITSSELINFLTGIKNVQGNENKYSETRQKNKALYRGSSLAEGEAIKLAADKAWPVHHKFYSGKTAQEMKLWKTIATDLNKNIPIKLSDGTTSQVYYKIDDTIVLGGSGTLTMSDGDLQRVTGSDGGVVEIPVAGDFERARILQLEHLQRVIYLLGDDYNFKLNVKTDETLRLDERYGVNSERKDFYMLTLNPSSITDLERKNEFVAVTESTYTYETDGAIRNDWVEYKPWPYMVFHVDANDPIFNYITNDGDITITSKDLTFDLLEDDPRLIKFVRRLPWTIILIPTNKDNLVYTHQISRQISYGERELVFFVSPSPQHVDSFTPVHLKKTYPYPDKGVSKTTEDVNAVRYRMNSESLGNYERYTRGSSPVPRKEFGVKKVLSALKDFKENWEVTNNTVTWRDVYKLVDKSQMKYLYHEAKDWKKMASLISLNRISSLEEVNKLYPKVKNVRSNNRRIKNPLFDNMPNLIQKPLDKRSDPPGPLE